MDRRSACADLWLVLSWNDDPGEGVPEVQPFTKEEDAIQYVAESTGFDNSRMQHHKVIFEDERAKVLTREEMDGLDPDDPDPYWVEWKVFTDMNKWEAVEKLLEFNPDKYGRTWRIWTWRPTEEERMETPWAE